MDGRVIYILAKPRLSLLIEMVIVDRQERSWKAVIDAYFQNVQYYPM